MMNAFLSQLVTRTFHSLRRKWSTPLTTFNTTTTFRPSPSAVAPDTLHRHTKRPPLRIIRLVETGAKAQHNGRIIMSGTMADVCAELERLAALETAIP